MTVTYWFWFHWLCPVIFPEKQRVTTNSCVLSNRTPDNREKKTHGAQKRKEMRTGQWIFLAKAEWTSMFCDFRASVLQMTFKHSTHLLWFPYFRTTGSNYSARKVTHLLQTAHVCLHFSMKCDLKGFDRRFWTFFTTTTLSCTSWFNAKIK